MASLIEKVMFSEYQVTDQVQKTNNQITLNHPIPVQFVHGTLQHSKHLCAHEPTNHDHTNG
jgi:hypothetical protein